MNAASFAGYINEAGHLNMKRFEAYLLAVAEVSLLAILWLQ